MEFRPVEKRFLRRKARGAAPKLSMPACKTAAADKKSRVFFTKIPGSNVFITARYWYETLFTFSFRSSLTLENIMRPPEVCRTLVMDTSTVFPT